MKMLNFYMSVRLATSRPVVERSEPCLAVKRPTASDEVARGRPRKSRFNALSTCG